MPSLRILDKNGHVLKLVGEDNLPPNVATIVISNFIVPEGMVLDYDNLMKALDGLRSRLKRIIIFGFNSVSPEYLALLAACFKKAKSLSLHRMSHHEEFEQVASSLSRTEGLEELFLNLRLRPGTGTVSNHILVMFLRALPSSSSLERLHLRADHSLDEDDLGNELISAIRGIRRLKGLILEFHWAAEWLQTIFQAAVLDAQVNDLHLVDGTIGDRNANFRGDVWVEAFRSPRCALEKFRLDMRWDEDDRLSVQRIFCSAILDAKMKELVLFNFIVRNPLPIEHVIWVNTLCRQNCMLEKLHLNGIKLINNECSEATSDSPPLDAAKNTSVKDLIISWSHLKCAGATEILSRFQSLESLHLSDKTVQSISLFSDMLLRNESTVGRLVLDIVDVQEDDLKNFLNQIPRMKSLRALEMKILRTQEQKVDLNSCVDLLENAVLQSTSLQQVKYSHGGATTDSACWKSHCDETLAVWLSLNRAGQGFLQHNNNGSIALGLLPLILERAGKMFYYSVRDTWGRPRKTDTRVDAVYWLLREKFFL